MTPIQETKSAGHIGCSCHAEETRPEPRGSRLRVASLIASLALLLGGMLIPMSLPLRFALHGAGWALCGWEVILRAARNIARGRIFDENTLMLLATIGAFILAETAEALAVMLFFQIGEALQDRAVDSSQRSIARLIDTRPETASVLKDGAETVVETAALRPGDLLAVRPGERFPADGTVISGGSSVDASSMTGESIPRDVGPGDAVLAGTINLSGLLTVRADKPSDESAVARILQLVQESSAHKAPTEKFITRFARVYTPIVVGVAALISLTPLWLAGATFTDWTYRGLLFLVVSCPCALVLSVPLGYFTGIGRASRKGVLIKGGQHLESLAKLEALAMDKTGTLTRGTLRLTDVHAQEGVRTDDVLRLAAWAESASNHPVAQAVRRAYRDAIPPGLSVSEQPGMGMILELEGETLRVGNAKLMREAGIDGVHGKEAEGWIHVAQGGAYLGALRLADEVKENSREAVDELSALGVKKVIMLSGDGEAAARAVAAPLGMEAHAGLMPDDKVRLMAGLKSASGGATGFAGDGINDAPVLRAADVGIAMGALGSDAALEAADIVLMDDNLMKLPEAVRIARRTRRVIMGNIVFALAIKALVLILGALGYASMWMAIAADVGAALVCVANSAFGVSAGPARR